MDMNFDLNVILLVFVLNSAEICFMHIESSIT